MGILQLLQIQVVDGISVDDEPIKVRAQKTKEPTGLAVFGSQMDVADNDRFHPGNSHISREIWTADVTIVSPMCGFPVKTGLSFEEWREVLSLGNPFRLYQFSFELPDFPGPAV